MQKRFITMLMLEVISPSSFLKCTQKLLSSRRFQATVPFFFLGVCVGVFTLAGLVGVELGLYALVMSTFVAMVPAVQVFQQFLFLSIMQQVQAILYIWHLRGRSGDRSPSHTTTVSAQRTTARSTTVRNSDSLVAQTRQESATGND